jgi:hypothetical protein
MNRFVLAFILLFSDPAAFALPAAQVQADVHTDARDVTFRSTQGGNAAVGGGDEDVQPLG